MLLLLIGQSVCFKYYVGPHDVHLEIAYAHVVRFNENEKNIFPICIQLYLHSRFLYENVTPYFTHLFHLASMIATFHSVRLPHGNAKATHIISVGTGPGLTYVVTLPYLWSVFLS